MVAPRATLLVAFAGLLPVLVAPIAASARDGESASNARDCLAALIRGKPTLAIRARYEHAGQDGLRASNGATLRTRLGYGTGLCRGWSAYADFENVVSPKPSAYFDAIPPNPAGRTPVADPEVTEVNQAYASYANPSWHVTAATAGRQRIVLDDARFIGNVGWRQNEQTFDAARLRSSLGVEGLELSYAYLWQVRRIFGNPRSPLSRRNFQSNSHLVNVAYAGLPAAKLVAFAYLLDLGQAELDSDTYGFRASGTRAAGESFTLGFAATYAFQTEGRGVSAERETSYYSVEAGLDHATAGRLGAGYEVLGSDAGRTSFATPLATAHAFNGWADVFLDNGGSDGLRDLYGFASPALPWGLRARLAYHEFWSDHGSADVGRELDARLGRDLSEHVSLLFKFAHYWGGSASRPDVLRAWLQLEFEL